MSTTALTAATFEETVTGHDIVLVDFWAEWCGPCRQFAPVFEAASEEHPNLVFGKVDTEAERELAGQFQITSIPTLMVFREQVLVFAQPGALPPAGLEQLIEGVRGLDMDDVRRQIEQAQDGAEVGLDDFAAAHAGGATVIDVRTPEEYAGGRVPGAVSIPMQELPARAAELPQAGRLFVICATGNRSGQVVEWLRSQGVDAVNVSDGTQGWAARGWPLEK